MKHDWESKNPAPNTKYFKYFGCHDLRECKNCGAVQAKEAEHTWGRVTGYYWRPKVGRCSGERGFTLTELIATLLIVSIIFSVVIFKVIKADETAQSTKDTYIRQAIERKNTYLEYIDSDGGTHEEN